MKKFAVIVASGKGLRMGTDLPKQFLPLQGIPVLMHTVNSFKQFDPAIEIILVLPKDHQAFWKDLCSQHSFTVPHTIVDGGSERFYSVKNGLTHITGEEGLVAIHDGVRPLVSTETINRCFSEAEQYGSAIPCIDVFDSVRIIEAQGNAPFDRSKLKLIQTPQTFQLSILKDAYDIVFTPDITDDASVIEKHGGTVYLTQGNRENIKITSPADLVMAEHFLDRK